MIQIRVCVDRYSCIHIHMCVDRGKEERRKGRKEERKKGRKKEKKKGDRGKGRK